MHQACGRCETRCRARELAWRDLCDLVKLMTVFGNAGPAGSKRPRVHCSSSRTNLTLPCSALDNQFRMSILERLEQMERRMAEMTGSQQHKPGSGGGSSGGFHRINSAEIIFFLYPGSDEKTISLSILCC